MVRLPISTRLLIHDGLHRRCHRVCLAAQAGTRRPDHIARPVCRSWVSTIGANFLGPETPRVAFLRSQGILCDGRDELALITKEVVRRVEVFAGMTELARSKISNRSLKLFTFSGIYHATKLLLSQQQGVPFAEKLASASEFWTEVRTDIPDWGRAKSASQPG